MSWLSHSLGLDKNPHTSVDPAMKTATTTAGQNATTDRNRYLDILSGGQSALNTSIQSAMASAMPSFMQQLQGVRESAVRRGISTGDLGTSYEGDLASAFDKNIANATGAEAMNLYGTQVGAAGSLSENSQNRYLDLLSGQRDYEMAQQNAKKAKSSALFGGLGSLAGAGIGSMFGQTALGSQIGGAIGGGLGG